MSAPLRFGIVGCGSIGPTHAGAIRQIEDAELVAVADIISVRASAMATKFGIPPSKTYVTAAALFADPDVDIVCLCTPSGFHADGAVAAMQAGKHVIIEKPMDVSLAACDRIIAAADETGRKCTVISQHRFDAATQTAREQLQRGHLGKLILATADVKWFRTQAYYDEGDWRGTWALDGGGALMNQGVHTVDLLQWLAGDVTRVYAQTRTAAHERIEVEDIAVASLTFASGAVGTFVASTAAYPGLPARIDLFGTAGSLTIEGDRLKQLAIQGQPTLTNDAASDHAARVAAGGTASVKDDVTIQQKRSAAADPGAIWGDAHRAQIADFIRAVLTDTSPLIDPRASRKPVELILAIYNSARKGVPVDLRTGWDGVLTQT